MHRDMNLVRRMLLHVAEHESVRVDGVDSATVEDHARLLEEGGLLTGFAQKKMSSQFAVGGPRLTWSGHELLDLARNEERWTKAAALIAEVQGASHNVWIEVLTQLAREELRRQDEA